MTRTAERKYQAGFLLTSVAMLGLLGAGLTAGPPRAPANVAPKKCKDLVSTNQDNSQLELGANTHLTLSRNKHWDDEELVNGKWVGVVKNTGPKPSKLFPELSTVNSVGCIIFMVKGTSSSAVFKADDQSGGRDMSAVVCKHFDHHPSGIKAELRDFETDCSDVQITAETKYGPITIDIVGDRNGPRTGRTNLSPTKGLIAAKFLDKILKTGIQTDSAAAKNLADRLAEQAQVYGAWWPCSQNGCCKAY